MKNKNQLKQSLADSVKALFAALKAAYRLAPLVVIVGAIVFTVVIWLTLLWSPLMVGTASLVVMFVSFLIFAFRNNFGEALLSLVGGLLAIFAFEWTPGRYISFMVAWLGFTAAALLLASLKIGAKCEEIYRMAALRMTNDGENHELIEKRLQEIGSSTHRQLLGPIQRAETLRLFAFRNLPIELFPSCLNAVETLSVITRCDKKTVAIFITDFVLSFSLQSDKDADHLVDLLNDAIKKVPVQPEDFFVAFESSRRLLISKTITPNEFLRGLYVCLSAGADPHNMHQEMNEYLIRQREAPTHIPKT